MYGYKNSESKQQITVPSETDHLFIPKTIDNALYSIDY